MRLREAAGLGDDLASGRRERKMRAPGPLANRRHRPPARRRDQFEDCSTLTEEATRKPFVQKSPS